MLFWGGNAFWKTVEVALQKRLRGGGEEGLHDCLRLPRLLTANTRQLEILVTTLVIGVTGVTMVKRGNNGYQEKEGVTTGNWGSQGEQGVTGIRRGNRGIMG